MICNKCGNNMSDDAKFCMVCGNPTGNQVQGGQTVLPNMNTNQYYYQNGMVPNPTMPKKSKKPLIIGISVAILVAIIAIGVIIAIMLSGDKSNNKGGNKSSENPFAEGLAVGQTVYFGTYEQDNNANNGEEAILWDVIGQNENGFLLLSHYVIDYMPYQEGPVNVIDYATGVATTGVTWETSSIRKYLNEEFINKAFSASEQTYIVPVTNRTLDFKDTLGQEEHYINMQGGVGGGNTKDSVFLLSFEDYCEYLKPVYYGYHSYVHLSIEALAAPTKYARKKGAAMEEYDSSIFLQAGCEGKFDEDYDGMYTEWLLRDSGSAMDNVTVMSVKSLGHVGASQTTNNECGIRPAIWVNAASNGSGGSTDNSTNDPYSKCIGYWSPKNVDSLSPETFWIHSPQVLEITETTVMVHGPNYSAKREELQHAERGGIHYYTSLEKGFRFYYSDAEQLVVIEIRTDDGNWIRWADFE